MIVGRECIRKFAEISITKDDKILLNKRIKDVIKIKRQVKINAEIPTIEEDIKYWTSKLHNNPFVLPKKFKTDTLEFLDDIKDLYNKYVDGLINEGSFDIIKGKLPLLRKQFELIEVFKKENGQKKYICTLPMKIWIQSNHSKSEYIIDKIDFMAVRQDQTMLPLMRNRSVMAVTIRNGFPQIFPSSIKK